MNREYPILKKNFHKFVPAFQNHSSDTFFSFFFFCTELYRVIALSSLKYTWSSLWTLASSALRLWISLSSLFISLSCFSACFSKSSSLSRNFLSKLFIVSAFSDTWIYFKNMFIFFKSAFQHLHYCTRTVHVF